MAENIERQFNTGEYTPGQEREPRTPAERAAAANAKLAGILRAFPMSNAEYLERTGGAAGMIEDFTKAVEDLQGALLENARLAGNVDVVEVLTLHDRIVAQRAATGMATLIDFPTSPYNMETQMDQLLGKADEPLIDLPGRPAQEHGGHEIQG